MISRLARMTHRTITLVVAVAASVVSLQTDAAKRAATSQTPKTQADNSIVATRRLTESQYRHSIADIFGSDIAVNGRFEPERREEGLLAIGASMLSISASGFEQYYSMAKGIADQVLDDKHIKKFLPCEVDALTAKDNVCTRDFVRTYGNNLFRRPLTENELSTLSNSSAVTLS